MSGNAATKQPPLVIDIETAPQGQNFPAPAAASDLMGMIAQVVAHPQANIDALERLIALKERMDARTAEEAFNAAMTDAQQAMRPIAADADNPQTRSRYASYAQLDRALRPIYTKHGFGLSYDTTESTLADHVRVLAYVTHRAGHARTYKVDMPNDGKGAKGGDVMTKTHAQGAAMSYGMRYLLKMIFNVAVGEDDRDGNDVDQRRPEAPEGYEDWLLDLDSVADEGTARLEEAWKKSDPARKRHLLRTNMRAWDVLKRKAAKVRS